MAGTRRTLSIAAVLTLLSVLGASAITHAAESTPCSASLLGDVPARPEHAASGAAFARSIEHLDGTEREARISQQVLAGNIPAFLRHLVPIQFTGRLAGGAIAHIVLCAMPDYLGIGSDADFLYVPVRLATALRIAQRFGLMLPTPRIVDAIYHQARVHLAPQPLPASDAMRSSAYYWHHNELIAEQRRELGVTPGVLSAGQKKDLVLTSLLWRFPDRVAIYGWHRSSGRAIQPLSTVHGWRYADYSHGVRFLSTQAWVDGAPRPLLEVLQDPQLARLLNTEGAIQDVSRLIRELSAPRS